MTQSAFQSVDRRVSPVEDRGISALDTQKPYFDGLILRIANQQDRQAFVTLFDYFAPRVKAFLMRGGLDEFEAEELAQETMLQVWRKAELFDPQRAGASTWIYTIARNKKLDRLRRNQAVMIDLDHLSDTDQGIAHQTQEESVMRDDLAQRLTSAINELPEEQAQLVQKAFFQDMSHAAIAADTKIPLGTVKSRLRLGLARLRKLLFEDNPEANPFDVND